MTTKTAAQRGTAVSVKSLAITAICLVLVYVFTAVVNIRLPFAPNGGLIHLGNVPLFVAAILFGKRTGMIAGGIGMALFDLLSGWTLWAPFTLVIVGCMGFVVGAVTEQKKSFPFYLLALLLAATCLILLLRPLRQMLHTIGSIGSGDFSVRMDETPYTETTAISHAFNDMADRLDTLFQEVYQRGLLLRDAEIHQLESQIQPHFIFNILELINVRCMVAGQPAICTTVQNLAQLLRASVVNHGKQIITLQEELDSVKYYLALQKERFEEKLQYTVDVEDDKLLGCYLPKLTIQPLIENSIVHGLEPKRHGGWVRVSIWEEEDAVYIRVHDDGVGFDPSAIPQPGSDDKHHTHVALHNIERRFQLLYGEPYGMSIKSEPGHGTSIVLTLPIITAPPEKEKDLC